MRRDVRVGASGCDGLGGGRASVRAAREDNTCSRNRSYSWTVSVPKVSVITSTEYHTASSAVQDTSQGNAGNSNGCCAARRCAEETQKRLQPHLLQRAPHSPRRLLPQLQALWPALPTLSWAQAGRTQRLRRCSWRWLRLPASGLPAVRRVQRHVPPVSHQQHSLRVQQPPQPLDVLLAALHAPVSGPQVLTRR